MARFQNNYKWFTKIFFYFFFPNKSPDQCYKKPVYKSLCEVYYNDFYIPIKLQPSIESVVFSTMTR